MCFSMYQHKCGRSAHQQLDQDLDQHLQGLCEDSPLHQLGLLLFYVAPTSPAAASAKSLGPSAI